MYLESGGDADACERRLVRSRTSLSEDADQYEWLSEKQMTERGFSAERIANIKRLERSRADKYEPKVMQYRVMVQSTGQQAALDRCSWPTYVACIMVDPFFS